MTLGGIFTASNERVQTIDVESGGVDYTDAVTITSTTGLDISTATVSLALGSLTAPGTFYDPDIDDPQADPSTRVVQLRVGTGGTVVPTTGAYWIWSKLVLGAVTIIARNNDLIVFVR